MTGDKRKLQYPDEFVAGLEWMWGEGFLSPGGAEEVATLLEDIDLTGKHVLDIGCGLGGVTMLLVTEHGAGSVVGTDVEPPLVDRAISNVDRAGLSDRIECRLVEPGPLPFPGASFDVVFSKDSMVHIPDKPALFGDVLRVLKPGGLFVASDWLYGGAGEPSEEMQRWLDIVHLDFALATPTETEAALRQAGFRDVRVRERNSWYREWIANEIAMLEGENLAKLARKLGRETAEHRAASTAAKKRVLDSGELCPAHLDRKSVV